MFAWVGSKIDALLNAYIVGVATSLMSAIAPIALTATTLWVALYGWAVLRHEVPETVPAFTWRVFKIGLVLTFALQSSFYIANVADTANALATGVATTFLPSAANPLTISSPYALLDEFNDRASQLVVDLMKEAGITRLDLVFAAVVTSFGNVLFLCLALFVVTLSKVFLTFAIAVGPLFILCLAWRPTARFFDSWLSMVLNAVVLTWFAFFALGLSAFMGDRLVSAIQDHGGFGGPTFNVVAESLKYCIVMILMAIICFQAPGLASALTGGVAVQQGLQMIQNTLVATRHRSWGGPRAGGPGRAGAASGVPINPAGPDNSRLHSSGHSGGPGSPRPRPEGGGTAAFRRAAQRGSA